MNKLTFAAAIFVPIIIIAILFVTYWLMPSKTINFLKTIFALSFILMMFFIFSVSAVNAEGGDAFRRVIQLYMSILSAVCLLVISIISNYSKEAHNIDDYLVLGIISFVGISLLPFSINKYNLCNEIKK